MLPNRPSRKRGAAAVLTGLALLAAGLSTVLSGCAAQREVLSEDRSTGRAVAVLTGTPAPAAPADPRFAQLTALQVGESLTRLIVRPSLVVSFVRGNPEPFLSAEQVAWAQDAIATVLPHLQPNQRLQVRFRDRFHGLAVEGELYGEGPHLVYRFTKLAVQEFDHARDSGGFKQLAYVELVERPGQSVSSDDHAYYVRDTLFGTVTRGLSQQEQLAELERAADARGILAAELVPAQAALEGRPDITLEAVGAYVQKLGLVLRAREQGLFTDAEAAERKQRLLAELTAKR